MPSMSDHERTVYSNWMHIIIVIAKDKDLPFDIKTDLIDQVMDEIKK